MGRIQAFQQLCTEWNGKRLATKLTESEFDEVVAFIEDNDGLPFLEFEYAANRLHLDEPVKPTNIYVMVELLHSTNTRAHSKQKS